MYSRLPPPSWLRTFAAAARHMSFTRAARELHVTQSAVSQQIRLLEDRLGEPLFHRLPQSLQLTEAGKAYLPVVRDAFERLSYGTEALFGYERTGQVTIRATPGFGEFWLAPRLHALYAAHPELELRIVSTIWNTDVVESGVDLEIRYGSDEWPELETVRLTREYLMPVCSPGLAERLGGAPERLAGERLLHVDGFRTGWPEWLDHAGVSAVVDGGSGSHFDTAILPTKLAEEGLGVALGRWSMVEGRIARGSLVAPFRAVLPSNEAFYAVWPADRELRAEAVVLRDWLVAAADGG
ncbi:Glycine cleavage system transcriptional activator [wastewater metagenome]|uniref:Glycine cleavage system transcriptional activator n=2 Tax=unclassified sequences TaxID=12908 RepID=A0A5B8RE65_9ZZZZ|nr:LysR substrate-binding domain-containing protein [Arhodomonas aquaeolei]MCS4503075.1 LysR substrate-binding domain-containing protein [Arhodomonas aquaeolei]QEA06896.1 glycine cleavage system transcriptional activator [uncultured organism]